MAGDIRVVCLGVHVLDVLARPVETIPDGQGGVLVEQIRAAPAGTAGGTAVTLAKLGASVLSAGAIGADPLGDLLVTLLASYGVDTGGLVRRPDVQTSASLLPIRANGDRPAFHVIGANGTYTEADVPWDAVEQAGFLHIGGPEFLGGEAAGRIAARARAAGVVTSTDLLADGDPGMLEWVGAALAEIDHLLPNREQVLGLTGCSDVVDGCRQLVARGVGCVAVTCGADGAVVVDADSVEEVPAFSIEVVDTSGCGDAFSAGYLRGLSLGRSRRDAAVLGCATAAQVATGLGSDHGDFDLTEVERFAEGTTGW